jgi:hypothetical protein
MLDVDVKDLLNPNWVPLAEGGGVWLRQDSVDDRAPETTRRELRVRSQRLQDRPLLTAVHAT